MAYVAGYWVDLANIQFNEDGSSTWIQAMPLGTYTHPIHGSIDITAERIARFADNVNNRVRDTELDIDYDHKAQTTEAAGWVKSAEARPNGLWILVDWTADAAKKIKSRAFKYFSPEFADEWTHPKTQVTFKDVLFGGGITNRPFLKDILPINLNELFETTNIGGQGMTPEQLKQLATQLGLPEDASAEAIWGALQTRMNVAPENPSAGTEGTPSGASDSGTDSGADSVTIAASEQLKQLSEANPAIKQLLSVVEAQGAQLSEQAKQLREAEVSGIITKLSDIAKGKNLILPPTSINALSEVFTQVPKTLSDSIEQAFVKLFETGLVEAGERAGTRTSSAGAVTATKQFNDAVTKIQTERKLSYADAAIAVSIEQPDLVTAYRDEMSGGN